MPRIRMCDEDREKYGGPEWVEIEFADITDESTGLVEQLEEVWNLSPSEFLNKCARAMPKGIRALIWLGLWKAGHRVDPRTFRPRTQEFSGVLWEPTEAERKRAAEVIAAAGVDVVPPANRATRRAAPKKTPAKKPASARRATGRSGS